MANNIFININSPIMFLRVALSCNMCFIEQSMYNAIVPRPITINNITIMLNINNNSIMVIVYFKMFISSVA